MDWFFFSHTPVLIHQVGCIWWLDISYSLYGRFKEMEMSFHLCLLGIDLIKRVSVAASLDLLV